jgi:ribosomal protein L11 methyltransferase
MNSYWWYITVLLRDDLVTAEENEEILYSAAEISGSIGTEVQELPNGVRMRIYYRADEELSSWRGKLLDALAEWPGVRLEDMGKIENQPWSRQSEDAFPPLDIGRGMVVLAPWHKGTEPRDRIPIYINPGSAFGTGYHESTQAALELFERHMESVNGCVESALDIGAGSGILTIAAIKLGVRSVRSRDLDPAVIDEVRTNLRLNDVCPDMVELETGDLLLGVDGTFDLLFANILLDPLLDMLPCVKGVLSPGGTAIFSGMTIWERERFLQSLAESGLAVKEEITKEEWWGVTAQNQA